MTTICMPDHIEREKDRLGQLSVQSFFKQQLPRETKLDNEVKELFLQMKDQS